MNEQLRWSDRKSQPRNEGSKTRWRTHKSFWRGWTRQTLSRSSTSSSPPPMILPPPASIVRNRSNRKDHLRELIKKTKSMTDKPFGVGIILEFPHKANIKVVLEEKVSVLLVSWGEYSEELVSEAHDAGVMVIHQLGSYENAEKAKVAGVDAIIVQGREAGGHIIGQEGAISLVPGIVDLVSDCDIPVIAAGGIVDGRGYVAALALGASGICLGTRFVATNESYAHPLYKRNLVELSKTEYTNVFGRSRWPDAPHRVLNTPFFSEWKHLPDHENEENQPVIGHTVIHGRKRDVHRFAGTVPNATTTGDIENMVMYAGSGVGLIKEILPAGEVVRRLVAEAHQIIQQRFSHI